MSSSSCSAVYLAVAAVRMLRTGCGRDRGKVLVVSGQDQYLYEPPAAAAKARGEEPVDALLGRVGRPLVIAGAVLALFALLLMARKKAR